MPKLRQTFIVTKLFNEAVVNDLADALSEEMKQVDRFGASEQSHEGIRAYEAGIRDCTVAIARVIFRRMPDYDMDEFYRRAGYKGVFPKH